MITSYCIDSKIVLPKSTKTVKQWVIYLRVDFNYLASDSFKLFRSNFHVTQSNAFKVDWK